MKLVGLYSGLLLLGILISQITDLSLYQEWIHATTMICLAFIMVKVGLEFDIDKNRLKSYGWDYIVAMFAAGLPWIFCSFYFIFFFETDWKDAWLLGRFAAPTSAGILFSMLSAAGLASTWFFKKVRVLAIFDDLDTVIFMIPLQMMIVGIEPQLLLLLPIMFILLYAAYRWLHALKFPTGIYWIFGYGILATLLTISFEKIFHFRLEVLLPSFVFGCLLMRPEKQKDSAREIYFDKTIKAVFMLLVGLSLPKVSYSDVAVSIIIIHVIALTILSNLGKCFPIFCYRKEASLRKRIAVSVAMFPRGEVGAGVLMLALGYGISGTAAALAGLSLALNLLLTGFFIWIVLRILKSDKTSSS